MMSTTRAARTQARKGSPSRSAAPPQEKKQVLVIGQTPPPYGGQALMFEHLVRGQFERIQVHHIRLGFSGSMKSLGRVELGKVAHLVAVLLRAIRLRLRQRIDVVVYSPAGPKLVPLLRDVVMLHVLRALFPRTVFHFHAAGLSEFLQQQPAWFRRLALSAYRQPDGAIQTSGLNPPDGAYLDAKRTVVVANGLPDEALTLLPRERPAEETVRVLCVGIIDESKGTMVLLEAIRDLALRNSNFTVWFMGQFGSDPFEERARRFCAEHGLEDTVSFIGQKVGPEKWEYFRRADILCFPTFFESESFGLVAVEGMMFGLPVVATRWRGIPDVVDHGKTGLLVPVRDSDALADALEALIRDPALRQRMGASGREQYVKRFTIDHHLAQMEAFLHEVASA